MRATYHKGKEAKERVTVLRYGNMSARVKLKDGSVRIVTPRALTDFEGPAPYASWQEVK